MNRELKEEVSAAAALGLCPQPIWSSHPYVCSLQICSSRTCLSRIGGEEEDKSWLLLTDVLPQTKAANVTWQKLVMSYIPRCLLIGTLLGRLHSFNTGNGTGLLSATMSGTTKSFLSREVGKCAWDQREVEQAGAFLGKPIYCISRTGLNVSTLHLCSCYTHTGAISLNDPNYKNTEGGTLLTNQTRLSWLNFCCFL